jgi:hypothetical protein
VWNVIEDEVGAFSEMKDVMVIGPVYPDHQEAEDVGKIRRPQPEESRAQGNAVLICAVELCNLDFEHQQSNGDREDPIAECLDPLSARP